ncbi:hypothetical protein KEJ31_07235 [Candidatus Bathyarchaeota archaeon]|nr:hypothetical protein [Candidatus Bathyarchaeota archaeon]
MVLHLKGSRKKNENLIAFRIPKELSVTLRKMGVNQKEVCLKALYEIANRNSPSSAPKKEDQILSPVSENRQGSWCGGWDLNP